MIRFAVCAAIVIATLAIASNCFAVDLSGRATVIEGDTIEINGQRIKLFGIDAPEAAQTCRYSGEVYHCGQQSALTLEHFIGSRSVTCDARSWSYEQAAAVCTAGDDDLGRLMVLHGQAFADRPRGGDYVADEIDARAMERGIWRGEFVMPWAWRKGVR
jgi:endonuclease YncB( thermonuclease family)